MTTTEILDDLRMRYPDLEGCCNDIYAAYELLCEAVLNEGKVLLLGNGGSAADADHIAGELVKEFTIRRSLAPTDQQRLCAVSPELGTMLASRLQKGIAAIPLPTHNATISAVANDIDGDLIFAQQVWALARPGDVVWAITTSGQSKNVILALIAGRARGAKCVVLTGPTGGGAKRYADVTIYAPGKNVSQIQERHVPIYHALCRMIEVSLFHSRPEVELWK